MTPTAQENSEEVGHSTNDTTDLGARWEACGAEYPRKQFRRNAWMSLNGDWRFAFDNNGSWLQPAEVPEFPLQIKVPFAPEAQLSGIGDTGFHQRCWYERTFEYQKDPAKPRLMLHFGAVDYEARVWLNGQFLGEHRGGHTPFCFDASHAVVDGVNTLTVRADDDPLDLAKPRGKQDWQLEPHSIWYPRTTGIWQTVWLERVSDVYIHRMSWTPVLERWEIGSEVYIAGPRRENLRLRVRLSVAGKLIADDTYQVINCEVHRRIALSDPGIDDFRNEILWSPESPTLIDAIVELLDGDQVIDLVHSYTALRSVSVQRGRFLLNGRPYMMRLVLDQGYWPESLLTPPDEEALKKDIELVKAAGFNGVRKHQKVEDPNFYYWADKLGLLVWGEMPSAYRFTHLSVERIVAEWTEVMDRDMNHPSLVVWVPFNESWGVPDLAEKVAHQSAVQALYHLTRTLDSTRPVIGNDGWESTATDILGIHDYEPVAERLLEKYATSSSIADVLSSRWPGGRMLTVEGYPHSGQPVMLTEFGGIACIENQEQRRQRKWGYSVCQSPEELRGRYEALLRAVHRIELFNGFCYTQFTDTFQEANGLFTMDRRPKFSINAMAWATRGAGYSRGELTSVPQPPPVDEPDFLREENPHAP
jgi:hypothetical protein